jgi:hypothetical protein
LSTPVFDFAHLDAFEEFEIERFRSNFQAIQMEILRYQLKAVTHFWQGPLLGPMWLRLGGSGEVTPSLWEHLIKDST